MFDIKKRCDQIVTRGSQHLISYEALAESVNDSMVVYLKQCSGLRSRRKATAEKIQHLAEKLKTLNISENIKKQILLFQLNFELARIETLEINVRSSDLRKLLSVTLSVELFNNIEKSVSAVHDCLRVTFGYASQVDLRELSTLREFYAQRWQIELNNVYPIDIDIVPALSERLPVVPSLRLGGTQLLHLLRSSMTNSVLADDFLVELQREVFNIDFYSHCAIETDKERCIRAIHSLKMIQRELIQLYPFDAALFETADQSLLAWRVVRTAPPSMDADVSAAQQPVALTAQQQPVTSSAAFFQPQAPSEKPLTYQERLNAIGFDEAKILRQYVDPVTLEIMDDPVIVNVDGDVLDRRSYDDLKQRYAEALHPVSRRRFYDCPGYPVFNQSLKSLIIDFVEQAEKAVKENAAATSAATPTNM